MNKESTSIFESYKLVKEQEMTKGQYGGDSNPPPRPSENEVQYNAQRALGQASYAGRMASVYISNNPQAFNKVFRNSGIPEDQITRLTDFLQSNDFATAFYNFQAKELQSSYDNAARNTNYADSVGDMAGRAGFFINRQK